MKFQEGFEQAIHFHKEGRFDLAEDYYRQILNLPIDNESLSDRAEAYSNLGVLFKKKGAVEEALQAYEMAIQLAPEWAIAYSNLGNLFLEKKQFQKAATLYQKALQRDPKYIQAYCNLGAALRELKQNDGCILALRLASEIDPKHYGAAFNLAQILAETNQLEESLVWFQRCLTINPQHEGAQLNLGNALRKLGRLDEAIERYQLILNGNPQDCGALCNLAVALKEKGKVNEAWKILEKASRIRPNLAEIEVNQAVLLFLQRKWKEGFRKYEARFRIPGGPKIPSPQIPVWTGREPLEGKSILVFTEQGFGDMIQFARYLEPLSKQADQVFLQIPKRMHRLFGNFVSTRLQLLDKEDLILPNCDFQTSIMFLPSGLDLDPDSFPMTEPYMKAEPKLIEKWKHQMSADSDHILKIGLFWQGNKNYSEDQTRSIPLKQFEPLLKIRDKRIAFFSLQRGEGAEQIQQLAFDSFFRNPLDEDQWDSPDAFVDTAAILKNLDLLITSDSSVVHLAGALGVSTWLLLSKIPDWRWLLRGQKTSWYPTIKIFRQSHLGEWQSVFTRVQEQVHSK